MSHEFTFKNNVVIITDKDTGQERFHQSFNPVTGGPWDNEQQAHDWAWYEYGYLLKEYSNDTPKVSTYTELPGWPTSHELNSLSSMYITTDTGHVWQWNNEFWDDNNIPFKITGTVTTHTELPGYPNSYSGAPCIKYITTDTNHVWRWNGISWDDVGLYISESIGE